MPNVGEVVYQPPADVVTSRRVLTARVSQADDDLHLNIRAILRRSADPLRYFFSPFFSAFFSSFFSPATAASPSSSPSSFSLPITSGSAPASGVSVAATASMTALGAATTQTVPSLS